MSVDASFRSHPAGNFRLSISLRSVRSIAARRRLIRSVRRILLNDAILLATETMVHAKYPLELFLRIITVSLEAMKIVEGLPKLEFQPF